MNISRLFNSVPKKLAAGSIVALAFAYPAVTLAASTVNITATTYVANANDSSSNWGSSTSAKNGEVVDIQVVYDNTEAAGSGKVANDLHVKINIPTTAGANQTISTTTSADNSNTVTGTAKVTLDNADESLQYIPGSAIWEHAASPNGNLTESQKVSDSVVTSTNGLVLENENPCQAGSVQVQARVVSPGVSVTKYVRENGTDQWSKSITAQPGDTVQYEIAYKNTGSTTEDNVEFRDALPNGVTYVPGSTMLMNSGFPNGTKITSDAVVSSGILVGSYTAGAQAFVMFTAKVATNDSLPTCGANTLTNTAYVQPQGMDYYYDTAVVNVTKSCSNPGSPTYVCTAFHVTVGDNRTVNVDTFTWTASDGSSLGSATLGWGDNSTPLVTNNVQGQTHTYAQDGTYTVNLSNFKVNGATVDPTGNCSQSVTISTPTTPTTPPVNSLPNTGAGDVIGIGVGAIAAGIVAGQLFIRRKVARLTK